MRYLLDTNVISEMRKGPRADGGVLGWMTATSASSMWVSALVLGELRRGVEALRRRDPAGAEVLDGWLRVVTSVHAGRVLPVDAEVADRWGHLNVPDPVPTLDGLLAATALVHHMTVVTRNTRDFARTGADTLNPFSTISS
jgi:predicted nucleic acid-binding protein